MINLKSFLAVFAALTAFGCGVDSVEKVYTAANGATEVAAVGVPTDYSLYALDATWTNQRGIEMQLAELQGRPVMMAMVFTNCRYACPIIVHDMKRIERELPQELADDIHLVLVSLDPERDDPEALALFARAYGLDDDRWTLLQGDAGDVRMLAATLGVRYKKEADGQYSHTNLVALLDDRGELLHREINPGGGSTSMIAALRRSTTPPSI